MKRPPWKIGVIAGLIALAIMGVVTVVVVMTRKVPPATEKMGEASGQIAAIVGVVAYLIARWRARRSA